MVSSLFFSRFRFTFTVVAVLLVGCSRPPVADEPVRAVKLLTVGASGLVAGQAFAGEVRARIEPRLSFQVPGKIIQRAVDVGQRVQPGQLLAQLDPKDYQLAMDAARAQATAARTQRDLAAAEFKRYQGLREQSFISDAELERREATLKATQATLEQALAQLAAQSNQAGYTRLVAKESGVITAVEAEVGQVVAAGGPVLRMAQDGPRDVVFAVPEDQVAAFSLGLPVTVRVFAGGLAMPASVREVAASADPVTRTFSVKAALTGSHTGPKAPPLGATAQVLPSTSGRGGVSVIKLPTSALRQEGKGSAVWVLDRASMTVRSQMVQIASADGNQVMIASGLAPGMEVVAAGVHVLSPGQKVTVYQARAGGAGAPAAASASAAVSASVR